MLTVFIHIALHPISIIGNLIEYESTLTFLFPLLRSPCHARAQKTRSLSRNPSGNYGVLPQKGLRKAASEQTQKTRNLVEKTQGKGAFSREAALQVKRHLGTIQKT